MGKTGDEPSLEVETRDEVAVCCIPGWKNLDRNIPVKVLLVCPVDTRHTSLAKSSQDFIFTKNGTNQGVLLHNLRCLPLECDQCLAKTRTVWPSWILSPSCRG